MPLALGWHKPVCRDVSNRLIGEGRAFAIHITLGSQRWNTSGRKYNHLLRLSVGLRKYASWLLALQTYRCRLMKSSDIFEVFSSLNEQV